MSKLLIGWAEESIVPDKKVNLFGQFFERISQYVESEITATAMAIESNGEQAIMVSADLISFTNDNLNYIREKVKAQNKEIDVSKIIIAATHTHTSIGVAPKHKSKENGIGSLATAKSILNEFLPEDKKYTALVTPDDSVLTPEEGLELVAERITKAIIDAWNNRKEALYANEFGRVAVGMCRRVVYPYVG